MKLSPNSVFCGDSYKTLQKIKTKSVDLCYLDPPFFAQRKFEVEKKNGKINSFDDTWGGNIENYLEYMIKVLVECHRVLKDTGSLYLHCDWHAVHYLKVELDKIFGYDNFRNEIIWKRHGAHSDTKQGCKLFGRIHDNILFYSKSKTYTWNPIYEPYPEEYVQKTYRHVEAKTGRRYAHGDLSGPGGRSKGNPKFEFLGITRYWRYNKEKMIRLYKEGKIVQTKKGNVPLLKRYLDEMPGLMLQDVWSDIKSAQVEKTELVDYPTQKPLPLLDRIIEVSTNEDDLILDVMSGCGTTLVAAKNLHRKFIGIDSNKQACIIAKMRLKKCHSLTKSSKIRLTLKIPEIVSEPEKQDKLFITKKERDSITLPELVV
jgi:DNA modification methylase